MCEKERGRKEKINLLLITDFWPDQRKIRHRNSVLFRYFLGKFKQQHITDLKHYVSSSMIMDYYRNEDNVLLRVQMLLLVNMNQKPNSTTY